MTSIKIHYIDNEWNNKFIIAKTSCGKDWREIIEFSQEIKYVTCKSCLNTYKNNIK